MNVYMNIYIYIYISFKSLFLYYKMKEKMRRDEEKRNAYVLEKLLLHS